MYTAKILNSIRWKCVIQLKYLYIKKCTLEKEQCTTKMFIFYTEKYCKNANIKTCEFVN